LQSAKVLIDTTVRNQSQIDGNVTLTTIVYDMIDHEAARGVKTLTPAKNRTATVTQEFSVKNPGIWSIDAPYLYKAVSLVRASGRVVDRYETTFGIRQFEFDINRGFFSMAIV
jgi:beta-galactosidase